MTHTRADGSGSHLHGYSKSDVCFGPSGAHFLRERRAQAVLKCGTALRRSRKCSVATWRPLIGSVSRRLYSD
jgi:hypothetical protein